MSERKLSDPIRATIVKAAAISAFIMLSGCALMHKPSPYKDPDQLVSVIKIGDGGEASVLDNDLLEWRSRCKTLGPIAAYVFRAAILKETEPERIQSALVSADFFPALGVHPFLGRVLLPEENRAGSNRVAVVSHKLWLRRFGADPTMIGKKVTLDQDDYTIVGVMQPDFQFPKDCDIWTPLAFDAEGSRLEDKSIGSRLEVFARLKPGVKIDQAQAELNLITRNLITRNQITRKLEPEYPATNHSRDIKLIPLRDSEFKK